MWFLELPKTSDNFARERPVVETQARCSTFRTPFSTESFPASWPREAISPNSMGQEANRFMARNSQMKTSRSNIAKSTFFLWQMQAETPTAPNSLSLLKQRHILTRNIAFLAELNADKTSSKPCKEYQLRLKISPERPLKSQNAVKCASKRSL